MPKANPIQASFARGEISPLLHGRVDLAPYAVAAKTILNGIVRLQGPIARRSGTRYVAAVKDSAKSVRLAPFEFSTTQAYVLEFGHQYVRFYRDEGRIESPPGTPVEIATPYLEADLPMLKFAQSADTLYIVHPSHAPRKLTRSSHTSWTLSVIDVLDGPYLDENPDAAKTMAPSATTGTGITLTASGHSPFVASDVGRLVRIKHDSTWGNAKITAYSSATQVTADVKSSFGNTSAVAAWRLGAWSAATGYPAAVTFFEERLWWAGSTHQPQTIWSSKSGDFETMAPSGADGVVADDNAIAFTLAANQVNVIRWLNPGQVLQIGTVGGLWILRATTLDQPLTPTTVQTRRHRAHGCADLAPREAGDATLFVTRSGRQVRELAYSFERDKYVAPDLTILAEHIARPGLVAVEYAQEPDPVLWCVRADGALLGMTYEREQEVIGWHRHVLGGRFAGGAAVVESLAVIPSPDGGHDQLWLTVKRTIGGSTRRTVEFMEEIFSRDHTQADAFFVDCGLTYDGAPIESVSGLLHLEGETVAVLAGGAAHPDAVVSGGAIALQRPASKVHVGLFYPTDIETLRPEAGAMTGTAQGQTKRIAGVTLRFMDTLGGRIGPDADHLDEILFRAGGDAMDRAPPLFTGDKYVAFDGGYGPDATIFIRQDQPLPLTLLAVMPRLVTSER